MNMHNFDFNLLAQLTEGCHFGGLKQVMRTACMNAKMEGAAVTQAHFERAIDSEVRQMVIGAPAIPENKEHLIAVHQAGKALASILLQPDQALCQVTVLPVTQEVEEEHVSQQYAWGDKNKTNPRADRLVRHGEMFSCHTQDALNMVSQKELHKQCQIMHAGNVAQALVGLDVCIDSHDREHAFKLAKKIILGGLDVKDLSKNTAEEKLTESTALFLATEKEVTALLTPHKDTILKIARELQKHKTLTAAQIKAIMAEENKTPATAA
jgi:ATP-dependent Zn protease